MSKFCMTVVGSVMALCITACRGDGSDSSAAQTIIGTTGVAQRFVVKQAGASISNFGVGEDKIVINLESASTSETLIYHDLGNPFAMRVNASTAIAGIIKKYPAPMAMNAEGTGVDIRIVLV